MKQSRRAIWKAGGVLFGILCLAGVLLWGRSRDSVVLEIGGNQISQQEWQMFLQDEKSGTAVYFSQKYHADVSEEEFWTTVYGETTPTEYAKENALEDCKEAHYILLEAKERGLIQETDYEHLRMEYDDFNKKRKEVGRVTYGPVNYEFYEFYKQLLSKLSNLIKEDMDQKEEVRSEELKTYYEEQKETLFSLSGKKKVAVLKRSKKESGDAVKEHMEKAETLLSEGAEFQEVCELYATDQSMLEYEFSNESEKADIHGAGIIYQAADKLSEGQISEIVEDNQNYYLVKLVSKEENQVLEFDEVKNRIRDLLLEERLQEKIKEQSEKAEIVIHEEAWRQTEIF